MPVGKDYQDGICPDLKVDGWDIKSVEKIETKEVIMEDEHTGLHAWVDPPPPPRGYEKKTFFQV